MMKMGTLSRSLWEALGVKGKPPVFLKKVMGKYPRRRSKSEEKKREDGGNIEEIDLIH